MPRDLFATTFEKRRAPHRSKWTIAGSVVAHVILVAAVLVLPVLSAFDNYVVQARNVTFLVPPAPVMPAIPAPPPKTAAQARPPVNPEVAPSQASVNPVVREPDSIGSGTGAVPPGVPVGSSPDGILGSTGNSAPPLNPPPPTLVKPIPVGGDVKPPTRLVYVDPVYPQIAIVSKTQDIVILEATIDESGVVRDVKVLRGNALLNQAAIDAVKRWRYTPTRLNGVAVPILLTVTVSFQLR